MRTRLALALALGTAALVVAVGADDGGFFPRTWRWLSLVLFAAAGAALLLRERVALSRRDGIALGTLFALAAWALASRAWSAVPALAGPEAERTLAYAAALLAGLLLIEPGASSAVPAGVLAASTILSASAIGDYVSSHPPGDPLVGPLGYANGAAALAAIGVVLAVGLATRPQPALARLVLLAPVPVLVATVVLARSAGAAIAVVVGLAVVATPLFRARAITAGAGGIALAAVAVWVALGHPTGGLTGNIRWSYWRAALDDYRGHAVLGSGAGDFGHYWGFHRTTRLGALDAHSLYVESLEELGPIGLALVLAFAGVVLRAAWRGRPESATAAAGFSVWLVHAGIDWDWELPAVTLPAILLGAVVLVEADAGRVKPLRPQVQIGLAVLAAALAVLAVVRLKA